MSRITIGPPGSILDWDNWGKPVTDAINEFDTSLAILSDPFLTGFQATSNAAAIGTTETSIGAAGSATFVTGRLYEVRLAGGLQDAGSSNRAAVRLRRGTTTAGTLWGFFGDIASTPGNMNMNGFSMLIANNTGTDIVSQCCLTFQANGGTLTHVGSATQPRGFDIWDRGLYANVSGLAPVSLIT